MLVVRVALLFALLFIVPVLLGTVWTPLLLKRNRLLACFPVGFFVQLAMFQLLALPFTYLQLSFSLLCGVFVGAQLLGCAYALWLMISKTSPRAKPLPPGKWETIYLILFLGLLGWQLYNVVVKDTTVWSYDDAYYVTYAADAVRFDRMLTIYPNTGTAVSVNSTRWLQSFLFYSAYLSKLSGIPVTVMNRTILEAFNVVLAYAVYAFMAGSIFRNKENALIFLIILSILHIYGFYSQYSITFRLLGPNYQGKAVLAASLCPLLFALMMRILEYEYRRRAGVLLLLLSIAATGLTMFGAAVFLMNTVLVITVAMFRRKRYWKHLRYIAWGGIMPAIYGCIYLIYVYLKW